MLSLCETKQCHNLPLHVKFAASRCDGKYHARTPTQDATAT